MEQVHIDAFRAFLVAAHFIGFQDEAEILPVLFLSRLAGQCRFYPGIVAAP